MASEQLEAVSAAVGPTARLMLLQSLTEPNSPVAKLSALMKDGRATFPAWAQLLVDEEVPLCVARLLKATTGQDVQAAPYGAAAGGNNRDVAVSLVAYLTLLLAMASEGCRGGMPAAGAMAEQVASPPVLAAAAGAARLVGHVPGWSPHAPPVESGEDSRIYCAIALGHCAAVVKGPLVRHQSARLVSLAYGLADLPATERETAALEGRRRRARQSLQRVNAAPAGVAAVAALHRAMAALRDSGVLADLCTAALAAPPCTSLARRHSATKYSEELRSLQEQLLSTLGLVGMSCAWHCGTWAVDILSAPPVLQLRMEGLAQLAASQEQHQHQQEAAASTGGSGGRTGALGNSGSSGSGAGSSSWPMLHADASGALLEGRISLDTCAIMLNAAAAAFSTPDAQEVFLPDDIRAGACDPTAAAQRVFPAPAQAAALLARACAAVCSRLEAPAHASALKPSAADSIDWLMKATGAACSAVSAVVKGAPSAEAAVCVPDALAAHAWLARAAVACAAEQPVHIRRAVWELGMALEECAARVGAEIFVDGAWCGWRQLGADVQAACGRALLPTRFMASLDAAVRHAAAGSGDAEPTDALIAAASNCEGVVPALGPALLRARLLPAAADVAAAAAVEGTAGGGPWRAPDELGVLVTVAKLARREACRMQATRQDDAFSEPVHFYAPDLLTALALTVHAERSLPHVLVELEEARAQATAAAGAGSGSSQADGAAAGNTQQRAELLSYACRAVADALTLCGRALLELQAAMADQSAADELLTAMQCASAIASVLPSAALLACAQPRGILAAAGKLLGLREREAALDPEEADCLREMKACMLQVVLLLSTDEQVLAAVAPGWLWAERPPAEQPLSAAPGELEVAWHWDNLAALAGTDTPPGPLVVVRSAAAAAALADRPWAEHAQCRREVAAMARSLLPAAHADADEDLARARAAASAVFARANALPWPPRVLKLCANPSCSNFAGACEADLKLKLCSGCRAYNYCGSPCATAHWPAHKAECRRRVAAAAAAAQHGAVVAAAGPHAAEAGVSLRAGGPGGTSSAPLHA